MSEPVWLRKDAVLAIHKMLLAQFGGAGGVRDEGLLESALGRPLNLWHYEADAKLPQLASAYAAGIVGNHPFVDGNKRTGFMAAYVFLDLNGQILSADEASATAMTLSLAASEIDERGYRDWLARNLSSAS